MATNYTLANLITDSLAVTDTTVVVWPQLNEEHMLHVEEMVPKFPGCYAANNSTVSFIYNKCFYVTPYTRKGMEALREARFHENYFYVPFSNGDYPKDEQHRWNVLRAKARRTFEEEFLEECHSYCDSHGIKDLSNEVLRKCFEMPESGIMVKHLHYQAVYYPILVNNQFNPEKMGVFTCNNGLLVFVNRDGRTYVGKSKRVEKDLIAAGYRETNDLFVPFSNSEQLVRPRLDVLDRWEATIGK